MSYGVMFTESIGVELEPEQQLVLAVGLWLRTLKVNDCPELSFFLNKLISDLGANKLRYDINAPELPENKIVFSNGQVVDSPGIAPECRFAWSGAERNGVINLTQMAKQGYLRSRNTISLCWLEWAIAVNVISFKNAGVDWKPEVKVTLSPSATVGGIEKVDWL